MSEYIEREAAIEECDWYANEFCECEYAIMPLKGALENLPAADVRPVVKAKWKHVQWVVDEEWQEGGYWISRCSNCSMPYHSETMFCPHCGAWMEES